MTVGKRIKLRREELGISQTDLAKRVKIAKQTLFKYENDIITNIPSDKIEAIAYELRVSASYLMGWEEKTDIINSADDDTKLLFLPKEIKEYAIKLSELSVEDRKDIMKMIDRLGK